MENHLAMGDLPTPANLYLVPGRTKLMRVDDFRREFFVEQSRPDARTVRHWLETDVLVGRRIGKTWYVDIGPTEKPVSPLVQRIMGEK